MSKKTNEQMGKKMRKKKQMSKMNPARQQRITKNVKRTRKMSPARQPRLTKKVKRITHLCYFCYNLYTDLFLEPLLKE